MVKWIKKLKQIVLNYDADLKIAHNRISELEKIIKERTNIAVDVGFRDANHIIVVGRYKNADYVQTYQIKTQEMSRLIDQLRDMQKYGDVKFVDEPPQFKAVFKRELSI